MNDDLKMCDSIPQIGHVLGFLGLRENFTVRAPKCFCDYKQHRIRLKRSIEACQNISQNNHLLDRNEIK